LLASPEERIVSYLMLRSLKPSALRRRAALDISALGVDEYTHFTFRPFGDTRTSSFIAF